MFPGIPPAPPPLEAPSSPGAPAISPLRRREWDPAFKSRPCIISNATVSPPGMVKSTPNAGGVATALTSAFHSSTASIIARRIRLSAMFSLRSLAEARGCEVKRYSSRACGWGMMKVGRVTLMNGTGIHPNSSRWPLNAGLSIHWGVSFRDDRPLYKGITRTLDRWIWARLSITHRTFSRKVERATSMSSPKRTICIRRSAGTALSSNKLGKCISVGATLSRGNGGSKTSPASFAMGRDRAAVGRWTSRSCDGERPSDPIEPDAEMRHPPLPTSTAN
mmetsp:Transcript_1264/g.3401  ORF Transcript_1264/g.3401 Transcript_1264/m.3401 type:complete len:277 (+) Transcript_1264:4900-5730(+)